MRVAKSDAAKVALAAAEAQPDQADHAIKSAEADVERTEAIFAELVLVARRSGRVQDQFARAGAVVGVVAAECRSNARCPALFSVALRTTPSLSSSAYCSRRLQHRWGSSGSQALLTAGIMQIL
jgi:hypothetical protein